MAFLNARYQKDLRNSYKPLNAKEERILIIRAQAGDHRAQNKLIDAQLFQIVRIANMYLKTNPRNELEDLISIGIAGYYNEKGKHRNGLIHAIQAFDVNVETRLITFAVNYIRNGIRDYSQDNDLVRNSRQKSKSRKNDPMHLADLEYDASLRNMTVDEYVEFQKERGNDISIRVKAEKFNTMSFDAPLHDNNEFECTLLDVLSDENAKTDKGTVSADIKKLISILDKNERDMLDSFFGLTHDKMTLEDIGIELGGLTRQGVSMRINKSIKKIHESFNCS